LSDDAPGRVPGAFASLTPPDVLEALDAAGLRGDGRILQLNSYENRVFQLFLEDGSAVVTKFYRPGRWTDAQIVEEHRFALELAAAEVPVVPPRVLHPVAGSGLRWLPPEAPTLAVLAATPQHRFTVADRCAGREPELEQPGTLRRIGAFIGRLHAVGARRPFSERVTLDPRRDGARARELLLAGGFVTDAERPGWQAACDATLDAIGEAFDRAGPLTTLRLHGDCHLGNVLWRDGPHVVDLDDACNGPAIQDLWMLVSGDPQTLRRQFDELLAGYEDFRDFDDAERALVEPLRSLRMLRHAAWLAERWSDPSFPINFPFFGTPAYWSQQTAQLREQCEAMAGR
jgi:Ser/Thr protein kinase RdoA (MazF antagonist)